MDTLKNIGEKELIRSIIKPLFNPLNIPNSVGDDCAVLPVSKDNSICVSTDRVPADLISYKIGVINHYQLGYYLAALNISDIASSGADPVALLLTLAFEDNFPLKCLKDILNGVKDCSEKFSCQVVGGDLSNSKEMSLSATSIGIVATDKVLYRSCAREGDLIFCSDYVGLTPTAFKYFLELKPSGFLLDEKEEIILANQFRQPKPRVDLGKILSESKVCTSCMDNTDGFSQTFSELSEINNLKFTFDYSRIPIHDLSYKVADKLKLSIMDLIFSAGADFQLLGSVQNDALENANNKLKDQITIIGEVQSGSGLDIRMDDGKIVDIIPEGWNYYQA